MAEAMTGVQLAYQERQNTGTSWTRHEGFDKDGYFVIKDLWDSEDLYHPVPEQRGQFTYWGKNIDQFQAVDTERQVPGSCSRYWHPQYRKVHTGVRKKLEKYLNRKLYNTYYYDRYYYDGQELARHADRDACEISVTIHVSTNLPDDLKDWPIKIKTPDVYVDEKKTSVLVPGEERSVILQPGDGMVYKGCERPHWRDPMPLPRRRKRDILLRRPQKEYYYHQIFFHYVLADGVRSHCAKDANR